MPERAGRRGIRGHALVRETGRWACKCGAYIKDPSAGRALARDIYRFHLLDVEMAKRPKGMEAHDVGFGHGAA